MIRKVLGLVFAAIFVITCFFKVVLAVAGIAMLLVAWLI